MQELTMTPATVAILLVILAWAIWAVRRLFFRGMCDCHGSDGRKGHANGGACASGCSSCGACCGCSAYLTSAREGLDSEMRR